MDSKVREKPTVTILINNKPRRRRLRVGDPDFLPPDGGWGWLIVFACGFSNLSTFPVYQQYGLIFREKFNFLGFTETQTTFIMNLAGAFNAIVGLTNGPVYRNFTYRKVSMAFSLFVAGSLLLCVFCSSFLQYVICFCVLYGSSFGFVQSANALALNTYFKEKRRIATGFSWTTTALGPIFWPYVIVFLESIYGMDGVLMLFAGFALHSFVCSLLLQPVEWHTKFKDEVLVENGNVSVKDTKNSPTAPDTGRLSRISSIFFSNQYFGNEDDAVRASYEIIDPGTPMMLRSNDGWYSQSRSQVGSRLSLSSNKIKQRSGSNSEVVSKRPSYTNLTDYGQEREKRKKTRKVSVHRKEITEAVPEEKELTVNDNTLKVPNEKDVLKIAAKKLAVLEQEQQIAELEKQKQSLEEEKRKNLNCWEKFVVFFDFSLLKDFIYVNIMIGVTIAHFAELNFSLLTPIILAEFNFPKYDIATFMSLLGTTDILVRFMIPFIADKIGWNNRIFFLIGVMSMALGRVILVHFYNYRSVALIVAVVIGAGKALRTIFMALVIPSHVPLEKLPAASGLQLAFQGIFSICVGPIVGWIRNLVGTYVITLHLLNLCTYLTAISWITEMIINYNKSKKT